MNIKIVGFILLFVTILLNRIYVSKKSVGKIFKQITIYIKQLKHYNNEIV